MAIILPRCSHPDPLEDSAGVESAERAAPPPWSSPRPRLGGEVTATGSEDGRMPRRPKEFVWRMTEGSARLCLQEERGLGWRARYHREG